MATQSRDPYAPERTVSALITRSHPRGVSPRALFRFFAFAEVVTWAGLITGLILRATDTVNIVPITGGVHGFVFLSYAVTTVFVWVNQKWSPSVGSTGLVLAIIPFATIPFELYVHRHGLLDGDWRLAPERDAPKGLIEQMQAFVLRRPVIAILLLLVLVVVLFSTLLYLGPPVPRA